MSSKLFLVLSLVVFCHQAKSSQEYVPVFMWGATTNTGSSKALEMIDATKFNDILSEQLDSEPFTVVFIEETLSVEDFSSKDAKGRTAYPGLREKITGESVLYLPFVASALHTLNKLADPKKIDRIHLTDEGLSADIVPGSGKFLYINLKDAREGEDRLHMLSRHDQFMTEMFDKLLKKHDNVLAMYTARYPSWEVAASERSRSRRELLARPEGEANEETGFYNAGNRILVFSSNISYKEDDVSTDLVKGTITLQNATADNMSAKIVFGDTELTLKFTIEKGYWWLVVTEILPNGLQSLEHRRQVAMLSSFYRYFNAIKVNEAEATNRVYAPLKFSYHCSPMTVFSDGNYTLTMADLQVQPFYDEKTPAVPKFNLAYDCVGFTSVPIWSGLFVVFLVIFITSTGIIMMMDIRTMDRFDDPKGKTITITASE